MTETTIDEKIREEIESIDWEAIGCELYERAADLERMGNENTVAVAAVLMDGIRAHRLERMREGDGRTIANGFAQALMRAHIASKLDDKEVRI
jgi:hypothetical protein